jgi:hypothetical protein
VKLITASTKFTITLLLAVFLLANGENVHGSVDNTSHCGSISTSVTWSSTGNVHIVTCNVTIAPNATLTVDPGAIVKFQLGTRLIVDGTLRILGSSENPVYLTSLRDDTVGGDTNGDGSATTPAKHNWLGIHFRASSNDANSLIDHAVIRYTGAYNYGAVHLEDASPTIQNTTLVNGHIGILAQSSVPNLFCNDIYDNQSHGIFNATPGVTVTAVNQWWGHGSGPYHAVSNPNGLGNSVSDGIEFAPWRTSTCMTDNSSFAIFLPIVTR